MMAESPKKTITLTSNKASLILGDLLSLVQESGSADALQNVNISFTCKLCKAKMKNPKQLVDHQNSGDCDPNAPRRARGRPGRPPKDKQEPNWCNQYEDREYKPVAALNAQEPQDEIEETSGRQTRMKSGAIKRKSALELLGMSGVKQEQNDCEYEVKHEQIAYEKQEQTRPLININEVAEGQEPAFKRKRGRPPKIQQKQHLEPALALADKPFFSEDNNTVVMNEELTVESINGECTTGDVEDNVKYPGDKTLVIKLVSPEENENTTDDALLEESIQSIKEIDETAAESSKEENDQIQEVTEGEEQVPRPILVLQPSYRRVVKKRGPGRPLKSSLCRFSKVSSVSREFRCTKCHHRGFPSREERDVHEELHFNDDPKAPDHYKCKVCEYTQSNWSRMLTHIMSHEEFKKVYGNSGVVANIIGEFKCPIPHCEKEFDKRVNMIQHLRYVHHKQRRHCNVCNQDLPPMDDKTYNRHIDKCNNVQLKCDQCEYTTKVRANLKLHRKIHIGQGLVCQICNATFPTRQRYRNHCLTHTENRQRYMCETCGQNFVSVDAVKKHCKRFHTGITEKTWKCDLCSYMGKLEYDLKKHIQQVHNKKYRCEECDYTTNVENNFRQHREYHKPDHIHPCPYSGCYFRATTTKMLANHVSKVHNIHYKNQCPICLKHFKKKTSLLRHLVTHTCDRPYVCGDCGESFYSHSTYYRHRNRTGHDEKREGIASVPSNITIQYLEEIPAETTVHPGALSEAESLIEQAQMDAHRAQMVQQHNLVQVKTQANLPITVHRTGGSSSLVGAPGSLANILSPPDAVSNVTKVIEVPIMNSAGQPQNINVVTEIDGTEIGFPDMNVVEVGSYAVEGEDDTVIEQTVTEDMQSEVENMEEVTYVLQVEDGAQVGDGGHTEELMLSEEETARIIEQLQNNQNVVYQDSGDGNIRTFVEMAQPGANSEQQYEVIMVPGGEPEAALSMLQLQSGANQS